MIAVGKYLVTAAVLSGASVAGVAGEGEAGGDAGGASDWIRGGWLPDTDQIVYWHWRKDRHGPALTGNASWRLFMRFLEEQLADAGVVDMHRNDWTFRRWRTSHWPDDSRWSLAVDGKALDVASFGANSGSTPAAGLTAPLVLYEEGDPLRTLTGKIAVLRTQVDPEVVESLAQTDYEYRSGPERDRANGSVSWRMFPQLMQTRELLAVARAGKAAGALLVFDAGRELAAGLYTFPVPEMYDVPTLILDRNAGAKAVRAARAGRPATLRLEADVVESMAYQLVGFLPGRHYGTPDDEVIQLVTHTDGPAISQDNGALGLLALVRYFSRVPREQRRRTLMVYLDCRHFMPGQEEAFAEQDYFARHPDAGENVVAMVAMEHLGQIEYREDGDRLVPTGRTDPSMIWTTDEPALADLTIDAVKESGLPAAVVRNVDRPGIHGRSQGRWYGMASPARAGGLPAVAIMGTMGAYWGTSSDIDRLDPELFRRQVATFVRITGGLMHQQAE